jgi:hypothetical protein
MEVLGFHVLWASVLLFFCSSVRCGFRRDSACHLALRPCQLQSGFPQAPSVALHECNSRCNLGRGAHGRGSTPTRIHIRPRPPARDNNPSRKLIEDDGRSAAGCPSSGLRDQPFAALLARFPVAVPQIHRPNKRTRRKKFSFFLPATYDRHAALSNRRSTRNPTSCPPSRQQPTALSPALWAQNGPSALYSLPCPRAPRLCSASLGIETRPRKMRHTHALGPP